MHGDAQRGAHQHSKRRTWPYKLMFHFPEERLCFYGAFSLRARAYRPSDDSSGASATSNAIRGVCRVSFSIDQAAGQARSHATARSGRAGIASSACRAPLAAAPGLICTGAATGSKPCCRFEGVKS
jgi:hypothetical protein